MIRSSELKQVSWQCVHYALREQVGHVKDELNSTPLTVIDCEASSIKNDSDLFDAISKALRFPDYFGSNWDALDECLSDMEWLPAEGYVLIMSESNALWKEAPYTAGKLVSAWQAAAEQWGDEDVPFHLVFSL